MSSTRQKAKPVFDPDALEDDLDDLWPTPKTAPALRQKPERPASPIPQSTSPSVPTRSAPQVGAAVSPTPAAKSSQRSTPQRSGAVKALSPSPIRSRPPEVLLSSEVYDEFYRILIAEKKVRRGLARTMGAIVLDAIESHAPRLAATWVNQQSTVGEGQLFERPSSNAVPRRRRHANPPRTVVLSGVTPSNAQRLDDLVQAWNAGTRSALVEQALRYEFELLPGE